MNAINSIRPGIHSIKYDPNSVKKRIEQITESKTASEANKQKQLKTIIKDELSDFNSQQRHQETYPELLKGNQKYYRSELLTDIYNKMSGATDSRFQPGSFVEYYA